MDKKDLVKYLKSFGIKVNFSTKARGHQGFFVKNRIDISKNLCEEKQIETLIHEFAHYVHSTIEPDMVKTGGTLEKIFMQDNGIIQTELTKVTDFVDKNSSCEKLYTHKKIIKTKIKDLELIIKSDYPKFMRSKKFTEFEKYIKNSEAKYLMKYDRIKIIKGFFKRSYKIYTIDNIEKDFPNMPRAFCAYIRLHSYQKKQTRTSAKINRINKYYSKPTELFARFIQGLYKDRKTIEILAPVTTKIFDELLQNGIYNELNYILHQSQITK